MTTFGRAPDNDVVLDDDTVSSHHATLESTPQGLSLTDLGSTNGTFVNGTRVQQAVVTQGDAVRLGGVTFVVSNGRLEPPSRERKRRRTAPLLVLLALVIAAVGTIAVIGLRNQDDARRESAQATIASDSQEDGKSDSPSAAPNVDLFAAPKDLGILVDEASASVISIDCADGSGSGWPIRIGNDVLIVTNHHVIEYCINTTVRFSNIAVDGRANVIASDAPTDLAVLRTTTKLTPLDTAQPPPVGAWLMVVGNPLGLERSVSYGTLNNVYEGLLITDAAINPGNSGGPVFDSAGKVVGVASAKISDNEVDRVGIVIGVEELCVAVLDCDGTFPG
ncbi:MAG: trypsin-like peptidase domain-containing protein [Actinomycetota bacterium]|nr:trypsin-like peptidase domain-containing protein [Actinomycetota bacterium]